MSDAGKAVFLSYASQDAEAAKKIADALRSSGVEVWFDTDGGLEHGDEWDRKIRRQIKECVLFLPIISANTQAREEGYFRLEWDMAAERARNIASGVAFILPVVVDGTREPDALVPDRFRVVQWTKLPGGVVPPDVLQRFLKLWSHRTGALKSMEAGRPRPAERGEGTPSPISSGPGWKIYAGLAVACLALAAGAIAWLSRKDASPKPAATPMTAAVAAPATTEAQELVARMWGIYDKIDDTSNEEWELAAEFGARATELEPLNAEAWAVYANVLSMPYIFGIDPSPERVARATKCAERAVTLAPESLHARLALANVRRLGGNTMLAEAISIIRELLTGDPSNRRVLRMAGNVFRTAGQYDEAVRHLERAAALPGGDRVALFGISRIHLLTGRLAEAEAVADRAGDLTPGPGGQMRKLFFQLYVHDDLDGAEQTLAGLPAGFLLREEGADYASTLWLWRRDADKCASFLNRLAGDTVRGVPKGLIAGWAYRGAGREAAAALQWQETLQRLEARLATSPSDTIAIYWKISTLASLGRGADAATLLKTYEQLVPTDTPFRKMNRARVLLQIGRPDEAFDLIEGFLTEATALRLLTFRGDLKHDPAYDAVRTHSRFKVVLARMDAALPARHDGAVVPTTDNKSVAVLPFANLSGDPAQEYFSDGLTDEILTALSTERDLRVVARTSAFAFKGKSMSLAEIARALNVAQVVEGSVRKSGNTVKITVSLTRASDGFSEPLGTFTEKLDDIFALQEKVARAVVEKLTKRTVTVEGVVVLTKNPEAYDLYLKARAERRNPAIGSRLTLNSRDASIYQRERLLQAAVTLDPSFAAGWAELASTQSELYNNNVDRSAERLALMKASVDHAVRLAPEMPEVLSALGRYHLISANDYPRAAEQFEKRIRLQPNNAEAYYELGVVQRRQGRWAAARANFEKTSQLDPGNPGALRSGIIRLLENGRRYEEAAQWQRRLVALQPDNVVEGYNLAKLAFKARGSTREVEDYLTGLKDTPQVLALRQNWMALQGNYAEAIRLGRQLNSDGTKPTAPAALQLALLLSATGDVPGARALLAGYPAELRTSLEREPANSTILRQLAFIEAVLGHRDEALRAARQGMELLPESLNPWDGASRRATLAFVLAWTGDRDGALTEYAKLLRLLAADSSEQNVREMRHHPLYFPLQGDRRFDALLDDPKNDEPLL